MNKRILNNKKLLFISILSFMLGSLLQASSTPTIVVTTQGLNHLEFFDTQGMAIWVSSFGTVNTKIAALTGSDKITFTASTKKFTDNAGTDISGINAVTTANNQGSTTLGKFNGNYMAMWQTHAGELGYATFADKIYRALSEIGDDTHKIVASGETLSVLKVGMTLSNGKSVIIPFVASQLTAIESHFGTGKHGVTISFSLGNPSGGNQGMTINVKTHTGSNVSGFPINLTAATLKTTDNSSVATGVTATGKFVQYQTNNMDDAVMIKTESHSFDFNEDATIIGGTPVGKGTTTLTQQLQALGANPHQSAVKGVIETYYNNDSSTIRGAWTTISSDLTTAGLSSMAPALKAELDRKIPVAKQHSAGSRF